MRNNFLRGILLFLFCFAAGAAYANDWSEISSPTKGSARVIGGISRGCIAGAVELPHEGEGYLAMHLERRRYFGHPSLIEAIRNIGRSVWRERLGVLHVGDLSQPRGGPLPSSHVSHQNGLDVDIWFDLDPDLARGANAFRSDVGAFSLLNEEGNALNRALWKDKYARMLEIAARESTTDRIFVNPHIKNELCRTARGDRSWLRKIRPWWAHHDHLHARLKCPPGNPLCKQQSALPAGDGCGELGGWLRLPTTFPKPGPKRPHDIPLGRMPKECSVILRSAE